MVQNYKAEFTKLNLLNFLQEQKFVQSDGKTEAAFLELMWRWTNGCLLSNNAPFESYFKSELERVANAGSCTFNLQNVPEKSLAKIIYRHSYGSFFNRLFNKVNYSYLFVAEFIYLLQLFDKTLSEEKETELCYLLGLNKNIFSVYKTITGGSEKLQNKHSFTLKDFSQFSNMNKNYDSLGIINIGICATMSAGKSTLVNALLGHDFLPARNEATTACITSVYDNDYLGGKDSPAICTYEKDKDTYTRNITAETLDEWNGDQNTNRIVIQADLENIASSNAIVAVHDTPGTNNSGDNSHHDTTIIFFIRNKMQALIYVVNSEHVTTTDSETLLQELKEKVLPKNNVPMIFVLNKADAIDGEKESLSDLLAQFKDQISKLGLDVQSKVIPVSAKAARLFKMALKGKADRFTEKEKRDFAVLFEVLKNDDSILKATEDSNLTYIPNSNYDGADKTITVGRNEYSTAEIKRTLENTGLINLEHEIGKLINK